MIRGRGVFMVPGDADFLAARDDGVIGVTVLLLVVMALEGDGCLDGDGIEFARKAGFGGRERSDAEC